MIGFAKSIYKKACDYFRFFAEHWEWSSWGACSVSCGFGVKVRTPFCLDENIDTDDCIPFYVPKAHEKQCHAGTCPGKTFSSTGTHKEDKDFCEFCRRILLKLLLPALIKKIVTFYSESKIKIWN